MYRGGQPGHFWPKLAGWFLVPTAGAIATRLLAPLVIKQNDTPEKQMETLMTLTGVCHALGAAGSWYLSSNAFENSIGTQAFFRGGMWSEMVSAAFIPGAIFASKQLADSQKALPPALPPAAVKGLDPKTHIDNIVKLLSGGMSEKVGAPRLVNALTR